MRIIPVPLQAAKIKNHDNGHSSASNSEVVLKTRSEQ